MNVDCGFYSLPAADNRHTHREKGTAERSKEKRSYSRHFAAVGGGPSIEIGQDFLSSPTLECVFSACDEKWGK